MTHRSNFIGFTSPWENGCAVPNHNYHICNVELSLKVVWSISFAILTRPIRPKQLSMVTWYLHGLNGCADVVMSAFPVIFMVNEWPVASQLVIYLWTFSLLTSTYKWKKHWITSWLHNYIYKFKRINSNCLCGMYVVRSQQVFLDKCYLTSRKCRICILTSSIIPSLSILNIVFEGFEVMGGK